MNAPTVNWNGVELLPRKRCCVCGKSAVPYGRTLDDKYLCSARCCSAKNRK